MKSRLGVDYEHEKIGFIDRLQHLALDLHIHRNVGIVSETSRVDQPELSAVPFGPREVPVASSAGFFADNGAVLSDDAVEERGLPNVGPPNKGDYGQIHAATPTDSDARTSMKSYDGKTGIGSDARTASRVKSSRKMLSSLIVSAGMSAMSRSWRCASADMMSRPTSSPAVVIVGPHSEFSATISSKRAPLTSESRSRSGLMSGAIANPVTTPIVWPSRRLTRSSPAATRMRSEVTAPTPFSICAKSP